MRKTLFNGDLLFKSNSVFLYSNILNILKLYNLNIDKRVIDNFDIIKEKKYNLYKKP